MEGSSLRMELESALEEEDYEEAARLRDALNSIDLED
jgi:protein-arginine kinase activator protein McsA